MAEQYDMLRGRVSRRGILKGAVLLSAGPLLLRSTAADAATPMGPRWISYGNDPQAEMTVSASIPGEFKSATVEYGADSTFGSSISLDVKGVPGVATRYGSARITGLSAGKTYSYRVRVDGQTGETGKFTTAPPSRGRSPSRISATKERARHRRPSSPRSPHCNRSFICWPATFAMPTLMGRGFLPTG